MRWALSPVSGFRNRNTRNCRSKGLSSALLAAVVLLAASCGRDTSSNPGAVNSATGARARASPSGTQPPKTTDLLDAIQKLAPLHTPLSIKSPDDWLAHNAEPGQSFSDYIGSEPRTPQGSRQIIYIQPIGDFNATQRVILDLAADYVGRCFNLPVTVLPGLSLSILPPSANRTNPRFRTRQVLTTYIINLLRERLPEDAMALMAFTAADLTPGEGWNYVFGQASTRDRVGVWSLYRFGDPVKSKTAFRHSLLRTLKLASHEAGHMFSMLHCTRYECNMSGTNSIEETDGRPLAECPECMAKICWAVRCEPVSRFKRLAEFCSEHSLEAERKFFEASINTLGN
jgi:archaemetzincin